MASHFVFVEQQTELYDGKNSSGRVKQLDFPQNIPQRELLEAKAYIFHFSKF